MESMSYPHWEALTPDMAAVGSDQRDALRILLNDISYYDSYSFRSFQTLWCGG